MLAAVGCRLGEQLSAVFTGLPGTSNLTGYQSKRSLLFFFHRGLPIFHFRPKILDLVALVRSKPARPMRILKLLDNLDQALDGKNKVHPFAKLSFSIFQEDWAR